jgi:hypothetical protein
MHATRLIQRVLSFLRLINTLNCAMPTKDCDKTARNVIFDKAELSVLLAADGLECGLRFSASADET